MKLEPIVNPHAKSGQGVQKKTKQEEKDELIEKTKKSTIDKYGVRLATVRPLWLSIKLFTCVK
jgi:hypothetical protein